MLEVYLLYALPLACRFGLAPSLEWTRILLSLLPIVVAFPSSFTLRLFPRIDLEREHVIRHAYYALAFSVSIGTSVRWSVVRPAFDACEEWAVALVAFLAIGCATLWWFVLSHVLENRLDPTLRTHQGDVTVLPLTLVAIATFVRSVPDDAVQFSRSVLFFVPVIVAWATLHFIAYHGFAMDRVTTLDRPGFEHHAYAALVVASGHLTLLECNAEPISFQFFPIVAAVLSQVVPLASHAPTLRPHWRIGATVVSAGVGVGAGALLGMHLGSDARVATPVVIAVVSLTIPRVAGRRWVVPAAAYATLLETAYLQRRFASHDASPTLRWTDVLAVAGAAYVALWLVARLATPLWYPTIPSTVPRHLTDMPQTRARWWHPSRLMRPLAGAPVPACGGVHGSEAPARLLAPAHPACPAAFRGVWWMRGNTFPMELIQVQSAPWRVDADGVASARLWSMGSWITHDATLAGLLGAIGTRLTTSHLTVCDDEWIRTDEWTVPWLRLLFVSYWIRRTGVDEMERLVVSRETGEVVWRYELLRVVHEDGRRTRHHAAYVAACEGRGYL